MKIIRALKIYSKIAPFTLTSSFVGKLVYLFKERISF